MRRIVPLICTVALLASASLGLAQSVATTPVGFDTVAVPAATDSTHPSNIATSCPFYQPAVFQGANSAVASNTLSFTGTTLTATLTAPPYLARLKTGPSAGRFFKVTSNTDTQLTLDTRGYTLVTTTPANSSQLQVSVGDSVEICPANTFGLLFPSGGSFLPGTSTATADVVWLWNGATWDQYFYDATPSVNHWRKSPGLASAKLSEQHAYFTGPGYVHHPARHLGNKLDVFGRRTIDAGTDGCSGRRECFCIEPFPGRPDAGCCRTDGIEPAKSSELAA